MRSSINEHIKESNIYLGRLFVMAGMVLVLFSILIGRAFYLQVVQHENYSTQSESNRINVVPIPPKRGLIYDRNGVILAHNQSTFSLEITPSKVDNLSDTLTGLRSIIEIKESAVEEFHQQRRLLNRRFKKISLKTGLSEAERARFAAHQHRFPGVSIEARLERHYPYGAALVHVIGYVGKIDERDQARIDQKNYQRTRTIGKLGLEKYYEDELHGTVGYQEVEVDARQRVVRVLSQQPPIPGRDLHLNIDVNLQLEARAALGDRRGAIVALSPSDGGVLAMVSAPDYDPNLFVNGIDHASYNALLQSQDSPLFNRVLKGKYSPGSTIKPFIGLLGLDDGVVNGRTRFYDEGWYSLEGEEHRYRDWRKEGRGWVNLDYAIWDSCDTYFYDLAFRLGIDKISEAMTAMGFGQRTGLDILGESPGLMPSRQWKRRARHQLWFPGETVIIGIGQGFWTTTPLQLATATAAIANHGPRYVPRLVNRVEYPDGRQRVNLSVLAKNQYAVGKSEHMNYIRESMLHTVTRGTAKPPFEGAPYTSGGKTGTVQLKAIGQDEEYEEEKVDERFRDNAMYVAFAPYDDAKIALSVVVENAGGGSKSAAPVARQIMDYYLLNDSSTAISSN